MTRESKRFLSPLFYMRRDRLMSCLELSQSSPVSNRLAMSTVYWTRPALVPGSSVQGLDSQAPVHLGGEFLLLLAPDLRDDAMRPISFIPSVEAYREESRKKVSGSL